MRETMLGGGGQQVVGRCDKGTRRDRDAGDARGPQLISVPRKEGAKRVAGERRVGGREEDGRGDVEGVPIYTSILNLLR